MKREHQACAPELQNLRPHRHRLPSLEKEQRLASYERLVLGVKQDEVVLADAQEARYAARFLSHNLWGE